VHGMSMAVDADGRFPDARIRCENLSLIAA